MLGHYFELARRSFRKSPGLTALMVLTLAMGVAACMTTLTVFRVLARDPIPNKSQQLFNVQLDAGRRDPGFIAGAEPTRQLTRFDAEALLREAKAEHQVMMTAGSAALTPPDGVARPFRVRGRWTSTDFFAMFDAPFLYGSGWSQADDGNAARVVVLSKSLNQRLFGGADSRGRRIRLGDKEMSVVGVLDAWHPVPHFFDLTMGAFADVADVFVPFNTALELNFTTLGYRNCWGDTSGNPTGPTAPCAWVQYWVQLTGPDQADTYLRYLKDYSERQRTAARFERPTNVRLRPVMDWLRAQHVVPADVGLQLWLALGFLTVCLANAVGLLLAKCLRRSAEISVRRALGAPRKQIFLQFLVEAGFLGLIGGLLGLLLTGVGLWWVRQGSSDYAKLAQLDLSVLGLTLAASLAASLLAGVLPAWRACKVQPALQLKTL